MMNGAVDTLVCDVLDIFQCAAAQQILIPASKTLISSWISGSNLGWSASEDSNPLFACRLSTCARPFSAAFSDRTGLARRGKRARTHGGDGGLELPIGPESLNDLSNKFGGRL